MLYNLAICAAAKRLGLDVQSGEAMKWISLEDARRSTRASTVTYEASCRPRRFRKPSSASCSAPARASPFEALAKTSGGNLHSDIAPEACISSPIDFPHAACADQVENLVRPEPLAWIVSTPDPDGTWQ